MTASRTPPAPPAGGAGLPAVRSGRRIASRLLLAAAVGAVTVVAAAATWQRVSSADGSAATPRHEAGGVVVGGRLYVLGGRGTRPLDVYDPAARTWRRVEPLPAAVREVHHFQPVAIGPRIYIVGALLCCYPREPVERTVHVYDTATGEWSTAGEMPAERARGSAATVVRDGRIYVLGGNRLGHDGGSVPWFDVFDPASGEWRALPDAPHARDHFTAVIVGERLVAAGGRQTDLPVPFDKAVRATDIYDFASGRWSSGADIPTPRAGTVTVAVDGEAIVVGGEIDGLDDALDAVEAYDVETGRWRSLAPLLDARHGGAAAIIGDTLHVVAGSRRRGGGPETASHETLDLGAVAPPDADGDDDGLDDAEERDLWMTDPTRPDTDDDGLLDGDETARGTDPLVADSDADGLDDGDEVARGTDPLEPDSDGDGLDDGDEVTRRGSDPTLADSDADGLDDGREIELGADPRAADSDGDGLADGDEVARGTDPLAADSDTDGLSDGSETTLHGTDPLVADSDADGLDDGDEIVRGTRPLAADSDDDGLADGDEVRLHGTDPLAPDSDADGLLDGEEIVRGTRPLAADSDDDGVSDGDELRLGTDPLAADSDADGTRDGIDAEPTSPSAGGGGGGAVWLTLAALGVSRLSRVVLFPPSRRRRTGAERASSPVRSSPSSIRLKCGEIDRTI